jgi:chorismate dehydratase
MTTEVRYAQSVVPELERAEDNAHILRVGQIKYTNALPICHFLKKDDPDIQYYPGAPSELNRWLVAGQVDVGLISAFAYAEHADEMVALRGLSISSRGPVGSIFFFSKRPMEELDGCTVALASISASSVNLLKILFAEIGVKPVYITREPNLPEMLKEAEGALLIADQALYWSLQDHGCYVYDLGEEWFRRTGLNMTFAVCAVPKRLLKSNPEKVKKIHRFFLEGKRKGLANLDEVVREAQRMLGQSKSFWRSYFSKLIYDFNEELVEGANAFFAAAHRYGLLAKPAKVELWGDEE